MACVTRRGTAVKLPKGGQAKATGLNWPHSTWIGWRTKVQIMVMDTGPKGHGVHPPSWGLDSLYVCKASAHWHNMLQKAPVVQTAGLAQHPAPYHATVPCPHPQAWPESPCPWWPSITPQCADRGRGGRAPSPAQRPPHQTPRLTHPVQPLHSLFASPVARVAPTVSLVPTGNPGKEAQVGFLNIGILFGSAITSATSNGRKEKVFLLIIRPAI